MNLQEYWTLIERKVHMLDKQLTQQGVPKDAAYQRLYALSMTLIPLGKGIETCSYAQMYIDGNRLENDRPTFDGQGEGRVEGPASLALAKLHVENLDILLRGEINSSSWIIQKTFHLKRSLASTDRDNILLRIKEYEEKCLTQRSDSCEVYVVAPIVSSMSSSITQPFRENVQNSSEVDGETLLKNEPLSSTTVENEWEMVEPEESDGWLHIFAMSKQSLVVVPQELLGKFRLNYPNPKSKP